MAFEWDAENPLARCRGETARANAALHDYAAMGPGRSLRRLLDRYQTVPKAYPEHPPTRRLPTLKRWSRDYRWQERVDRHDGLEREAGREALRAAAIEDKKKRIASLERYRDHVLDAMSHLDPDDARHKDVTAALRMVTGELRAEYDDEPAHRHEVSGSISEVRIYIPDNGRGDA